MILKKLVSNKMMNVLECSYEAESLKDLEVHDDGYNERRNL